MGFLSVKNQLISDGKCSYLSGKILDSVKANSSVVFLYGKVNLSPWVRGLFVDGVSSETFSKYSDEQMFLADPYIGASLTRGDTSVHLIDCNDRDVTGLSGAESYWRFIGRHNLGNCAAFTRRIGDKLLLIVGLHGCTKPVSGATEFIHSLSDAVMARMLDSVAWQIDFAPDGIQAVNRPKPGHGPIQLSAREDQLIRLVMCGLRNKQIAHELSISENTVESHLRRIYQKLGVQNRTSLMNRMTALDRGHPFVAPELARLGRTPARAILEVSHSAQEYGSSSKGQFPSGSPGHLGEGSR